MAAEGPSDLPVPDLRTMDELCQPSLNGRGGPIAPIAIQATNFRLKNDMIQQVKENQENDKIGSKPDKNGRLSQVDEASKKYFEDLFQNFYDEYFDSSKIMKSSTTNVETSINEEVFHEVPESFQWESSSFSLNDDVQQSPEEVILPQTNTQSIPINMVHNGNEVSTSHNVFNERLEDTYFDASTSFHDPSNVHTYYQPYPHEKKWTKDHPLHKIIGDPKMNDLLDDNNFFIFDDVNVRISLVSKMPFRKKPRDSMNIVQICLWIIDSGCSKHMTGNRALLTNFVEIFLRTVCFGNNDFAVIASYGNVGLEVAFRKSTCFVRNKDGVDLLTDDRSSNLYSIAFNEVASNYLICLLEKASSLQSWLWHQHEASEVIISFIKKTQVNLQIQVQRVRTNNGTEFKNKTLAKFFDEVGITQQFYAARTQQQNGVVERRNRTLVVAARTMLSFANLPSFLWAEAITTACFTQKSCYLLNDYEDVGKLKAKGDIGVFVGYSKESAAFTI
nr:hypothetical protein [Tanacetum cinerariifolium]